MKIYQKIAALLAVVLITACSSTDQQSSSIMVKNAYARVSAPTVNVGAAFMQIRNPSTENDVLLSASTPISQSTEIHLSTMKDGMMKMEELENGLELPAKSITELKPGSYHIMLIGLQQALKVGDQFPLSLKFQKSADVTVKVVVSNSPPKDKHQHNEHDEHHGHKHHHHHHHDHDDAHGHHH